MHKSTPATLALVLSAPLAQAQFAIDWYTVDGGGGPCSGGTFSLNASIGQPDAATMSGGTFSLGGGFWAVPEPTASCYPNCDNSTTAPVLNVLDFACFLNRFASSDSYANCDNSTTPPTLNVLDFACFLNKFATGCT